VNIEVNNNNLQDIRVDFFPFLSKDQSSQSKVQSSQTYTFTFQPNSAEYNAQTVEAAGKIAGIGGPSGTKVFKAISSSPFQQQVSRGDSVAAGDILQVELDANPTAKETVEVVVSFADITETKTLPEDLGGDGNYMYVVSHPNSVVNAINLTTEAVTNIAMPSDFSFNSETTSIHYRYIDKTIHVFYREAVQNGDCKQVIIDADPNRTILIR